jgi:hypothetical protein
MRRQTKYVYEKYVDFIKILWQNVSCIIYDLINQVLMKRDKHIKGIGVDMLITFEMRNANIK